MLGRINGAVQSIPGLSGVNFREARVGVQGKAQDCCDTSAGDIKKLGKKEVSGYGQLTAAVAGIPLWGPPTITKKMNFGVAEVSVDFEVGARFDTDFRINAQFGRRADSCGGDNCNFGEVNASLDPQVRATVEAIVCTDTIWTRPSCTGLTATPAAIRFNFRVGGRYNRSSCSEGLEFFYTVGRITFRAEFALDIPAASRRVVFEHVIYGGQGTQ